MYEPHSAAGYLMLLSQCSGVGGTVDNNSVQAKENIFETSYFEVYSRHQHHGDCSSLFTSNKYRSVLWLWAVLLNIITFLARVRK